MPRQVLRALFAIALSMPLVGASACVTPKAGVLANGNLDRQFINIYFKPAETSGVYLKFAAPVTLAVVKSSGTWLEVAGTPDSPFKNGEVLGWVKKSDVTPQDLRNCN